MSREIVVPLYFSGREHPSGRTFRIEDRRGPVLKGLNQPAQMFHRLRPGRPATAGFLRGHGGRLRPDGGGLSEE